jgi:hypothetical protein
VPASPSAPLSLSDSHSRTATFIASHRMRLRTTVPPPVLGPPRARPRDYCGLDVRQRERAAPARRTRPRGRALVVRANWGHINRLSRVDQGALPRPLAFDGGPHHAARKKQQLLELAVPWWASDWSLADGSQRCQGDRLIRLWILTLKNILFLSVKFFTLYQNNHLQSYLFYISTIYHNHIFYHFFPTIPQPNSG